MKEWLRDGGEQEQEQQLGKINSSAYKGEERLLRDDAADRRNIRLYNNIGTNWFRIQDHWKKRNELLEWMRTDI